MTNSKGFFVIAQNSSEIDYVKLAYVLAMSIKSSQNTFNNISIGITPGYKVPEKYKTVFDEIVEIPWNDNAANSSWKLENEWKTFHMSPYDETIKLEADMILPGDISGWWDTLGTRDIVITSEVHNIQNELSNSLYYRPGYAENNVPTLYSAFMYFKKSQLALDFFKMAEIITWNWERFYWDFMPEKSPEIYSTDTTFSLAAKILDEVENIKSPWKGWPSFIHAKTKHTDWKYNTRDEDWSKYVPFQITPKLECFFGAYKMYLPVHYHLKHVMKDEFVNFYEKALGIE